MAGDGSAIEHIENARAIVSDKQLIRGAFPGRIRIRDGYRTYGTGVTSYDAIVAGDRAAVANSATSLQPPRRLRFGYLQQN